MGCVKMTSDAPSMWLLSAPGAATPQYGTPYVPQVGLHWQSPGDERRGREATFEGDVSARQVRMAALRGRLTWRADEQTGSLLFYVSAAEAVPLLARPAGNLAARTHASRFAPRLLPAAPAGGSTAIPRAGSPSTRSSPGWRLPTMSTSGTASRRRAPRPRLPFPLRSLLCAAPRRLLTRRPILPPTTPQAQTTSSVRAIIVVTHTAPHRSLVRKGQYPKSGADAGFYCNSLMENIQEFDNLCKIRFWFFGARGDVLTCVCVCVAAPRARVCLCPHRPP